MSNYVSIASQKMTTNTNVVTFGSIPSGYKDLRVVVSGCFVTDTRAVSVRINNTSSSSYGWQAAYNAGATTSYNFASSDTRISCYASWQTTASSGSNLAIIDFFNYTSSVGKDGTFWSVGATASAKNITWGNWYFTGTSAITTIEVSNTAGTSDNFATGTIVSLYGIG